LSSFFLFIFRSICLSRLFFSFLSPRLQAHFYFARAASLVFLCQVIRLVGRGYSTRQWRGRPLVTVVQSVPTVLSQTSGVDAPLLCPRPDSEEESSSVCPSAAPTVWNSLSVTTRTANSIGTFRSRLKTDLFAKAYGA